MTDEFLTDAEADALLGEFGASVRRFPGLPVSVEFEDGPRTLDELRQVVAIMERVDLMRRGAVITDEITESATASDSHASAISSEIVERGGVRGG